MPTELQRFIDYRREFAEPLPATRREVCPTCDGEGTTWHGWGGSPLNPSCAFTETEWAELGDDDLETITIPG